MTRGRIFVILKVNREEIRMIRTNMHIHSKYSWDAKMELEDIAKILIENNIRYAALTDHVEFDREEIEDIRHKFSLRNLEINRLNEKYHGKLKLLKGVEISEPHWYSEQVKILTDIFDFDFVMGSIHDMIHLKTSENKEYVTYLYYKRMLEMIEAGQIDVVGHLDYINRYYQKDYSNYNQVTEVLQAIKEHNQVLEINTSAQRRAKLNLFPSINKICRYKLVSDYVTIGTDAHRTTELVDNLEQAEYLSKEIGLKPVIFEKRKKIVL